jgi:hypothetical protein
VKIASGKPGGSALLLGAALALAAVCLGACGSGSGGARSRTGSARHAVAMAHGAALPQPELTHDYDYDSDTYPHERDVDLRPYPHLAGPRETRVIAAVVRGYYAAAARNDGAAACALMTVGRAESMPEDHGPSAGSPAEYSETCAQASEYVFRRAHAQIAAENARLRVVEVRTYYRLAAVRMLFGRSGSSWYLTLMHERGVWRVVQVLANQIPVTVN